MSRLFRHFLFFCGRVCCRFPLQKLKGIFMRTVWSRTFYRVQQFEKSVLVELQKFKTQTHTITRNLRRRTQKCQQKYMYKKERPQSMDARNVDHTSNVRLKNLQTVLRGKTSIFCFWVLIFGKQVTDLIKLTFAAYSCSTESDVRDINLVSLVLEKKRPFYNYASSSTWLQTSPAVLWTESGANWLLVWLYPS